MTRGKKISLGIIALFTVSVVIFLVWFLDDIDPVDDSAYLPDEYVPVPGIDNAFKDLQVLHREFLQAQSREGNFLENLMTNFDEKTDEILASNFSKALEDRLRLALKKEHFKGKEVKSFDQVLPHLSFYRTVANILANQAVNKWQDGKKNESLRILKLIDDLSLKCGSQQQTTIGVLVVVAMYGITDSHILSILDLDNYTAEELRVFQQLNHRQYLHSQLRKALKNEYVFCFKSIFKQTPNIRKFVYLENETRAVYLKYIDPIFQVLGNEKLYIEPGFHDEAYAEFQDYCERGFQYRNLHGKAFLSMILPPYVNVLKKIKKVYINKDLLDIRIALELYRKKHQSYPEELESLIPAFISELPKDPWSKYKNNYIYDREVGKLYSIGENYHDDGGDFKESLSYYGCNDFGIIFK